MAIETNHININVTRLIINKICDIINRDKILYLSIPALSVNNGL